MERVYFSISTIINYINDNKPFQQTECELACIILLVESNKTFINKFKWIDIKPFALTLRSFDKSLTLTHQTLIDAFNK